MVGCAMALIFACNPHQLPTVADWMRGTGRRGWVQRLEMRRGCDRRDYWCKRKGGNR